jgi:hypothetical protein
MECLNNGFNKFKVDDSIHVKMLIVKKMLKFVLIHIMHCVNKVKITPISTSIISNY